MDCSWLYEEADGDSGESLDAERSDSEEVDHELESRLYAIVHHNDLSQPLPLELAKHYSLQRSDEGDFTVTLNHSLEEIKSEESKEIDKVLEAPKLIDKELSNDPEVVVISDDENDQTTPIVKLTQPKRKKIFRYSDVNIDEINESKKEININSLNNVETVTITNSNETNHLKNVKPDNLKGHSNINIPSFFDFSNWNPDSASSFTLIKSKIISKGTFRWKLKKAIIHLNPGVKRKKLFRFADDLLRKNFEIAKQAEKIALRNAMRNNLINGLDIMKDLPIDFENNFLINGGLIGNPDQNHHESQKIDNEEIYLNISPPNLRDSKQKCSKPQNKVRRNGSVALNISPFKPNQITENAKRNAIYKLQSHFPTKWSKKMIAFYTMPSKSKIEKNLDSIFQMFDDTTTAEEWWLDPRDETGVYHRSENPALAVNRKLQRRCTNCKQRTHLTKNCPEKKKITACFLCGDFYHTGYSCQKTVCIKCGVYSPEGECVECYYHNFQFNTMCGRCGSALHRTPHCPDSWRSFHVTIGGELKIPKVYTENRRKFCCNCAHWGHFSHNCPEAYHTGQQTSPFVTNYSNSPLQNGTTEIFLPKIYEEIMNAPEADMFLQDLSDTSSALIEFNSSERGIVLTVNGTFEQCNNVRSEIEEYVNTKKRKREEPVFKRKRRRLK